MPVSRLTRVASVAVFAVVIVASAAVPATAVVRVPVESATDCSGQVPIVVASDDAAQSDIYSAVTLAGVLGSSCVVLAGARMEPMASVQRARLEDALAGGWIVGGLAAVPAAKTEGRDMKRLAGADRWHTARLVGAVAADPDGDIGELTERSAASISAVPKVLARGISAGESHSCALRADGVIECWGENALDQTDAPSGKYTQIASGGWSSCGIRDSREIECWGHVVGGMNEPPAGSFTAVDVSSWHACGIRVDQTLECWGANAQGQSDAPSGAFVDIATASWHSCAIRTDRSVECWGSDDGFGRLDAPEGAFGAVAVGDSFSCAIHSDRSVECWGSDRILADTPSGSFSGIVAGPSHACAIRTDDTIECWGDNKRGQTDAPEGLFLAVAAGQSHSCAIRADRSVACWGDERSQTNAPSGTYAVVDSSDSHSCAIDTDGMLSCWGDNDSGEIDASAGIYTAVAAGFAHTCAIRAEQTIACWGNVYEARLGEPAGRFVAVDASSHSCAIRADGTIACWGENIAGRTDAPAGTYTAITVGNFHSCAIRADKAIKCWGADSASDRSHGSRLGFGQASPPSGAFTTVAAGLHHTCAIRTSGTIACWGRASLQTDPPSGSFTALAVGGFHSCALRTDQTIACWGSNRDGQTEAPSGDYTAVTAGQAHSCAIRTDQTITCWGQRGRGQTDPPDGIFGIAAKPPTLTSTSATGVRIPPEAVHGECDSGTVPVVVASDLDAQPDIYSAATLAGVLGDACIVLAGARDKPMPADQQTRLTAAAARGYVVGGVAAVPDAKTIGRSMTRIGGADRWATARLVGDQALRLATARRESMQADILAAEALIADRVNAFRSRSGLSPLTYNSSLAETARDWSETMRYDDLVRQQPRYTAKYPVGWRTATQSVARVRSSGTLREQTQAAFETLHNGTGLHAMTSENYNHIGIGIAVEGRTLWVTLNYAHYP